MTEIDIVFASRENTPDYTFVEVESPPGRSIRFGVWVKRPDGFDALRFAVFSLGDIHDAVGFLKWEDRERVFDILGLTPYQREQE